MKFEIHPDSFKSSFLESLLEYSKTHEYFVILNSNGTSEEYDILAGFGRKENIGEFNHFNSYPNLWKFGYFGYDLKNKFEDLYSANHDRIDSADIEFFVPRIIISLKGNVLEIKSNNGESDKIIFDQLKQGILSKKGNSFPIKLTPSLSKEEYISKILHIKGRIKQGDIYEMNFCMEYFAEGIHLKPEELYLKLNTISEAPFSSFCRFGSIFMMGSSPERFIKKQGNRLITQPIKGTAPRNADIVADFKLKEQLHSDPKERNENVMIVDVSRNDLSRIAKKGTVEVNELFGVYSFKQVHQMISSVSCEIEATTDLQDIMHATFPPASMTGAPKIRAMQIIEETENFKRGMYSGVLGSISPENDFDFNVIIRSILYNETTHKVSYAVGSAITDKCDPEKEYEECLLKAEAMKQVLEG
ncbi:MAG: chorismate-binding protein [Bacteroidota bacterium]|nr:chorismate-binding protein [Bacteroidota bacterium]